ncbi:hypothetical protein RHGRI_003524 [Rhododendron griersonianum]|uniref:Auxin-responsive protein n=1 Tax=Rhododendron griersonianum TaxID=479676 RepID=A0AAV6L5C6_9ERIC|nr:hypothetical protein RHGRI_003524 [Rhododendron griersonianum]
MEVGRKMSNYSLNNLKETELCLGLPGGGGSEADTVRVTGKRGFSETVDLKLNLQQPNESVVADLMKEKMVNGATTTNEKSLLTETKDPATPPAKAQLVGWPPVRSSRKNVMSQKTTTTTEVAEKTSGSGGAAFVKVSMDGAPYLRKVDLKMYKSYQHSEYVPSYEDKDGDWMLVGDVPWEMFVDSCNRLRIMKGSEAIGLAPRAMEKCKSRC